MRLTTGAKGDGDPIGMTLRSASASVTTNGKAASGARKTGVVVHVVPREWWWAGCWESLCNRMVVELVGWHDDEDPDPRLCLVCAKRLGGHTASRIPVLA